MYSLYFVIFHADFSSNGFSIMPSKGIAEEALTEENDNHSIFWDNYSARQIENCKICSSKRIPTLLPDLDSSENSHCTVPSKIEMKYFDLLNEVVELLQGLHPHKIIDILSNITASDAHGISYFTTDFIDILRECTTTTSILRIVFPYTNWFDHSIIRDLVEACNCPKGVKLLDEFDCHIDLTLCIKKYPIPEPFNIMSPDESSSYTLMAVKYDQQLSSLQLNHIGVVRSILMKTFKISKHSCVLLAVANHHSAIFFWLIPKSIVSLISNEVQQYSDHLYDKGMLELAIYPNFSFSTGGTSRIWKLVYFSDIASMYNHVSYYPNSKKAISM